MNFTRVLLVAFANAADFTYSFTYAGLFAGLEIYIGIITTSLPTFGPLFSRGKLGSVFQQKEVCTLGRRSVLVDLSKGRTKNHTFDESTFERLDDDIPLREGLVHSDRTDEKGRQQ